MYVPIYVPICVPIYETHALDRGEAGDNVGVLLRGLKRDDVTRGVRPSDHHDPEFAAAARRASEAGVVFRAVRARVVPDEGTWLTDEMPCDLQPYDKAAAAAECQSNRATTGWTRTSDGKRIGNSDFAHNVKKAAAATGRAKKKKKKAPKEEEPAATGEGGGAGAGKKRSRYFPE